LSIHLCKLLIFNQDIPATFIDSLLHEFTSKIEVELIEKEEDMLQRIAESNLVICNSIYKEKFNIDCATLWVVTNNSYTLEEQKEKEFVFDPFRNSDRSNHNFSSTHKSFLDYVRYTITRCKIPFTPDDSVNTIVVLN